MKNLLIIISLLCSHHLIAQEDTSHVYDFADIEPQYPGGESAMMKFINENLEYPEIYGELDCYSTVFIQFIVNTDGSLSDIHSVKSDCPDLANPGIEVVKKMPNWIPGTKADKAVRVKFTLPITICFR